MQLIVNFSKKYIEKKLLIDEEIIILPLNMPLYVIYWTIAISKGKFHSQKIIRLFVLSK